MHLRNRVNGLASACHFIVNIGITEAAPSAFDSIHQNYYYVFVGFTACGFIIAYFYFPETRRRSLEEIAAAFGDEIVSPEDVRKEIEEKGDTVYTEKMGKTSDGAGVQEIEAQR